MIIIIIIIINYINITINRPEHHDMTVYAPLVVRKLVAVVVGRHHVHQQDVFGLGVKTRHLHLVAREHPPGMGSDPLETPREREREGEGERERIQGDYSETINCHCL